MSDPKITPRAQQYLNVQGGLQRSLSPADFKLEMARLSQASGALDGADRESLRKRFAHGLQKELQSRAAQAEQKGDAAGAKQLRADARQIDVEGGVVPRGLESLKGSLLAHALPIASE